MIMLDLRRKLFGGFAILMIVNNDPGTGTRQLAGDRTSEVATGDWLTTKAGASESWRKSLEPGNYFLVCGQAEPFLGWNGPWLTVAE